MTYLIDGYNLMHAIGLARRDLPTGMLQRHRNRFLDWLADRVRGRADVVRVVFDALGSPAESPESDRGPIRVRFAFGRTADDEIEELLASEPHPERVAVVSNDARVRTTGRRRGAGALRCEEFIDLLIEPAPAGRRVDSPDPEKPEPPAGNEEMSNWLEAFSRPPVRRRKT
jgi:predicted RNA-binding protein with PIN domain